MPRAASALREWSTLNSARVSRCSVGLETHRNAPHGHDTAPHRAAGGGVVTAQLVVVAERGDAGSEPDSAGIANQKCRACAF